MRIASDPAYDYGTGRGRAGAAPSLMPDGPAVRVGSDDRAAAILPAPARV